MMPGWLPAGLGSSGCVVADRVCGCGLPVTAARRGRWCSSWCEAREAQGLPAQPPPGLVPPALPPLSPPGPAAAAPTPAHPAGRAVVRRSVAERVLRDLEAAGMADSWLGAAALDLAESIDGGGFSSGSSRAAVHRELRAIMADALRGSDAPGSSVGRYRDELAARRAKRAGGG